MIHFINKNGGVDTSDATATVHDIMNPKTAYVNGEKITGSITANYKVLSENDLSASICDPTDAYEYHDPDKPAYYTMSADRKMIFALGDFYTYLYPAKFDTINSKWTHVATKGDSTKSNTNNKSFLVSGFGFNGNPDQCLVIRCVKYDGSYSRPIHQSFIYDKSTDKFTLINWYNSMDLTYDHAGGCIQNGKDVLFHTVYSRNNYSHTSKIYKYQGEESTLLSVVSQTIASSSTSISNIFPSFLNSNCVVDQYQITGDTTQTYTHLMVFDNDFNVTLDKNEAGIFVPNSSMKYVVVDGHIKKLNIDISAGKYTVSDLETDISLITNETNYYIRWITDNVVAIINFSEVTKNCPVSIYQIDFETCTKSLLWTDYIYDITTFDFIGNGFCICHNTKTPDTINVYTTASENSSELVGFSIENKQYTYMEPTNTNISDVKENKLFYSNGQRLTGTMPDNGEINITPTTEEQQIPAGYTSGGTVSAVTSEIDSNILPENIKKGVTILNVEGTLEADDSAVYINEETMTGCNFILETNNSKNINDYSNIITIHFGNFQVISNEITTPNNIIEITNYASYIDPTYVCDIKLTFIDKTGEEYFSYTWEHQVLDTYWYVYGFPEALTLDVLKQAYDWNVEILNVREPEADVTISTADFGYQYGDEQLIQFTLKDGAKLENDVVIVPKYAIVVSDEETNPFPQEENFTLELELEFTGAVTKGLQTILKSYTDTGTGKFELSSITSLDDEPYWRLDVNDNIAVEPKIPLNEKVLLGIIKDGSTWSMYCNNENYSDIYPGSHDSFVYGERSVFSFNPNKNREMELMGIRYWNRVLTQEEITQHYSDFQQRISGEG